MGTIPGWGRPLGEGNGYPLQYSFLGNPMDRGAYWATYSLLGCRELNTTGQLSLSLHFFFPGILGEYLWGNIFQPTTKGNELYEWLCDCLVGGWCMVLHSWSVSKGKLFFERPTESSLILAFLTLLLFWKSLIFKLKKSGYCRNPALPSAQAQEG